MRTVIATVVALLLSSQAVAQDFTLGSTKGSANYQTAAALSKVLRYNGLNVTPIPHRGTQAYIEWIKAKLTLGLATLLN